ncbi:hypothetical protein H9651_01130 [Microbacterium sp. Sa4CUA7]|uniref:Uncharacterized protein n=1 Tax=Microbacterium pullorum TaxID=2762236 RepID=A0ABR8RYV7_9MICO|nr:hypothetical protein [Microbacterium pullorum]MBD7956239.1 hypothetical protein [Microbacterium pullorum]
MPENTTPDTEKETIPTPPPLPTATPTAATTPLDSPEPAAPAEPAHAPTAEAAAPAAPAEPVHPTQPTTDAEKKPFMQRTWVRATGAAVAGVVLLGVGFGAGWAVSDAVEPALAGNTADAEIGQDGGPGRWQQDETDQDGEFTRPGPGGGMHDRGFGDSQRPGDDLQDDQTQDDTTAPEDSDRNSDSSKSDGDSESDSTESDSNTRGDRDRTAPESGSESARSSSCPPVPHLTPPRPRRPTRVRRGRFVVAGRRPHGIRRPGADDRRRYPSAPAASSRRG